MIFQNANHPAIYQALKNLSHTLQKAGELPPQDGESET